MHHVRRNEAYYVVRDQQGLHAHQAEPFDKDGWHPGGSAVKVTTIVDKWMQLNSLLRSHLPGRPFQEHGMVATYEPYGLHARNMLTDETFTLTPRYRALIERLAAHKPSHIQFMSKKADTGAFERLLALIEAHI
jgi:hypothetical protein